jgi:peptidoglycan/LPS O-acetylase OafA/YrhL
MEQRAVSWIAFCGLAAVLLLFTWWALRRQQSAHSARPGPDAYDAFLAARHFSGLDALRAISVLAVIWAHVSGEHALHLLNQGHLGVDFFFAISGFLVTTLLLRERRQSGRISLRNFYVRRTLRIFPLYYAVLALYCVLVFFTLRGTPKAAEFWANLPAFLTYTSNWMPLWGRETDTSTTFYFAWSLATEEQFYLFWPPLLLLLLKAPRAWAPAAFAVVLVALQGLAWHSGSTSAVAVVVASLAPAILFGVALAVLLDQRHHFDALWPVLGHRLAAPLLAVVLVAAIQFQVDALVTRALMALLVASLCVREDTVLHPALRWRPAVLVGTVSYGIYLMHMLAANVVRKLLGHASGIDVFLLTSVLVFIVAYISFRYFESPILRLKNRFQAARPDPRTAAPLADAPVADLARS